MARPDMIGAAFFFGVLRGLELALDVRAPAKKSRPQKKRTSRAKKPSVAPAPPTPSEPSRSLDGTWTGTGSCSTCEKRTRLYAFGRDHLCRDCLREARES